MSTRAFIRLGMQKHAYAQQEDLCKCLVIIILYVSA